MAADPPALQSPAVPSDTALSDPENPYTERSSPTEVDDALVHRRVVPAPVAVDRDPRRPGAAGPVRPRPDQQPVLRMGAVPLLVPPPGHPRGRVVVLHAGGWSSRARPQTCWAHPGRPTPADRSPRPRWPTRSCNAFAASSSWFKPDNARCSAGSRSGTASAPRHPTPRDHARIPATQVCGTADRPHRLRDPAVRATARAGHLGAEPDPGRGPVARPGPGTAHLPGRQRRVEADDRTLRRRLRDETAAPPRVRHYWISPGRTTGSPATRPRTPVAAPRSRRRTWPEVRGSTCPRTRPQPRRP